MNQINKNQEAAENPNKKHSLYLANIIFLCCLTIVSLVFALVVFFRLRTDGTDGIREFYTKKQIANIEENAASNARNDLLLEIQSSLASGKSTTQMLREIFHDSIVVVSGGKYYFYPLADGVEKNPLEPGSLRQSEGMPVYSGEDFAVKISPGILLSDNNGKVDWERLSGSGIEEAVIRVGILEGNRFVRDQQFERNCEKAVEKGKRVSLCLEVTEPSDEDVVQDAFAAVREVSEKYGFRELAVEEDDEETLSVLTAAAVSGAADAEEAEEEEASGQDSSAGGVIDPVVLLRIRTVEELSDDGRDRDAWTNSIKELCEQAEADGARPVIGASLYSSAAQIDLASLSEYDRWVIDHEETAGYPYSFLFWEYSGEGHMEGVPGESVLYVRVDASGSEEDSQ